MTRTIKDIECEMSELEEQRTKYPHLGKVISLKLQELSDEYFCIKHEEQEQEYDDFINEEELITRKGVSMWTKKLLSLYQQNIVLV